MMLRFLGTRGYIDARSSRHQRHSAALLLAGRLRIWLDCGEDWAGQLEAARPDAVFITHAHPDHAFGLRGGAPCPVYATPPAWDYLAAQGIRVADPRVLQPREPVRIGRLCIEAFPAEHSTLAPTVGFRIQAGKSALFYIPDVVYIYERHAALAGASWYVGDGASLTRALVRKPAAALVGHASMQTQLGWCQKEGVPRAVFTHCGTPIVTGDEAAINAALGRMASERGLRQAQLAYDGLEIRVTASGV